MEGLGDPNWMPLYDAAGNLTLPAQAQGTGLAGLYAQLKGWLSGPTAGTGLDGAATPGGAAAAPGAAAGGPGKANWNAIGKAGLGMVNGSTQTAPVAPAAPAFRPTGAAGALEQLIEVQRKHRQAMRGYASGTGSAFGGAEGGAGRGGGLLG